MITGAVKHGGSMTVCLSTYPDVAYGQTFTVERKCEETGKVQRFMNCPVIDITEESFTIGLGDV